MGAGSDACKSSQTELGSLLNSTQKVEVDMVARYQEEQDKIRKEWEEEEINDMILDQFGDVVIFNRGRALDFLHLLSIEPEP